LAELWGKICCLKRPMRRGIVLLKNEELAWYSTCGEQKLL